MRFKTCKKERKENLLFGQTEEYKIALKNLNNYLDENKYASICDYQQLVTPEIDNKTFYALHAYAFEVEKVEQIVDIFPTDYVFHKGICFQKTYGQGTHYCACRYLDNKYVFCGENS